MIGVAGNAIQETRYRRVDDRDRDDYARLEKDRTTLVKPGDVSLLVPEVDEIHAMDNFSDRSHLRDPRLRAGSGRAAALPVQPGDRPDQVVHEHEVRQLLSE